MSADGPRGRFMASRSGFYRGEIGPLQVAAWQENVPRRLETSVL